MRARGTAGVRIVHSRGREVAYEIAAASKLKGPSHRKYAEGDSRRSGANPCNSRGGGGPLQLDARAGSKMWVSTISTTEAVANAKLAAKGEPAKYTYARGTLQLAPGDLRPRSVRRQSYKPEAVAA